ncbi:DUF5709 domain-containing protein [Dactylosporangium sp. NPDC051541]|uniref:DUF5709 domain-containing protein n=1 Tax=Dactylosporangium sp. NPDC051541 TaxID=3363977 RepID=UPI0037903DE4
MRTDDYPNPVSDPEAAGLPGTADDDSSARDDDESGRIADGPDPGALPLDRDDRPLAVDHFGTTPEEAREGEPLDLKLEREVPDPALEELGADRPDARPVTGTEETFDPDALATEVDALEQGTVIDEAPVEPNLDSPVSMYDTGIGGGDGKVGRLVEPDEGLGPDEEKDAIAYDAGSAGGGASAEEAALHEVPEL